MKFLESQSSRWKLLRDQYRKEGVTLFLGAGVSTGCKLPDWRALIDRVAEASWGPNAKQRINSLLASGLSLPAVVAVLESEQPKGTDFLDLLRSKLYRDFPFRQILKTDAKRRELVRFVHGKTAVAAGNSTMRAVAAFCAVKSSQGFGANPLVHAVITSNVDAVFRTYVRARYDDWLLRTIGIAKHSRRVDRIPTYYMHGFLHFDDERGVTDKERVPCVFTEGEYFDFFNRPHSVFNYTFLYLLREFHCVFVGSSMQDQNVRRLLHYSVARKTWTSERSATVRSKTLCATAAVGFI